MALPLLSPLSSLLSPPSTTMAFVPVLFRSGNSASRLQSISNPLYPKLASGFQIHVPVTKSRDAVVLMAATDAVEPAPSREEDPSEDEEESIPVEDLPLESKLQLKLEQKMKMKIAKKIRLRRKRLVRKRRMRKKGRWPPSKMKKLKNV